MEYWKTEAGRAQWSDHELPRIFAELERMQGETERHNPWLECDLDLLRKGVPPSCRRG